MEITEPPRRRVNTVTPVHLLQDGKEYGPRRGSGPMRRWEPAPPQEVWTPEPIAAAWLRFPPAENTQAAYGDYLEFRAAHPSRCLLSCETGLPAYLYGRLQEPDDQTHVAAARRFLTQHERMLSGREGGIRLEVRRVVSWPNGAVQVRLVQVSAQDVPVYGGQIVCTFSGDGTLWMVSSSLYPATAAELDTGAIPKDLGVDWLTVLEKDIPPEIGVADDGAIAKGLAPATYYIFPQRRLAQEPLQANSGFDGIVWERTNGGWRQHFVGELEIAQMEPGEYRLVEHVPFRDKYNERWVAFIDVERRMVASYQFDEAQARVNFLVFPSSADAVAARPYIANGDANGLEQVATAKNLRLDVNLGAGVAHLTANGIFAFSGDLFGDPSVQAQGAPLGATDLRRFLGANTFFHLWGARRVFAGYLQQVTFESAPPPAAEQSQNPLQAVAVELSPAFLAALTKLDETNKRWVLALPRGDQGAGQNPSFESALDADVIIHEYTHALLGHYFPALFQHNNESARDTARRGLNEAVAYFFACLMADHGRWAECAYAGNWGAFRNLDAPLVALDQLPMNDPAGDVYSIGLWWAKALWRMSHHAALQADFPLVLLQALEATASMQATTATGPNRTLRDEVNSLFRNLGEHLQQLAQSNIGAAGANAVHHFLARAGVQLG